MELIKEIKSLIEEMEKGKQYDSSNLIEEGSKTKFVLHEHLSEGTAGRHYDIRLLVKNSGNAPVWSFALPKVEIPESNKEKKLAVRTPDHFAKWLNWSGYINDGYGKGEVRIVQNGNCVIHKLSERKIQFSVNDPTGPINGTYYLIRTNEEKHQYLFFKSKEQLI